MKITIAKSLAAAVLVLSATSGLTGCTVQSHRVYSPPPNQVHTWYPQDYFYYPGVRVYFHIHSGYYWYHDRGRWHRSRRLPPYLAVVHRDRVRIRVDSHEPWRHHQEHVRRYPPPMAPRENRHPDRDGRGHREREGNQPLYRTHRERSQPRDRQQPQGIQKPRVRQERHASGEPKTRHERGADQARRHRQRAQAQQSPPVRPGPRVREERRIRHEPGVSREPRVHKEHQPPRDSVGSQASGENRKSTQPGVRLGHRDRYLDDR